MLKELQEGAALDVGGPVAQRLRLSGPQLHRELLPLAVAPAHPEALQERRSSAFESSVRCCGQGLGDDGAELLAALCAECPALDEMHLSHNFITAAGAAGAFGVRLPRSSGEVYLVHTAERSRSSQQQALWLRRGAQWGCVGPCGMSPVGVRACEVGAQLRGAARAGLPSLFWSSL